tara:strand:+ start:631 stop:1215 length:585 start_codon:yes stop_codon:yes gene_type:complete
MSTLKVDEILKRTGTGTITIGQSGDTVTIPSGATLNAAGSTSGLGKVAQVLSTTKTDTFTVNSRSYSAITGLSVSITPSSTSSKILVIVSLQAVSSNNGDAVILRDSTQIGVGDTSGSRTSGSFGDFYNGGGTALTSNSASVLDSPSSTSAITYSVSCLTASSSVFYVNRTTTDTDNSGYSRGASTITVMEILA